MDSCRLEVHPAYGAIPRDGDEVGRGEVIGLSADSRHVIIAPIAGHVTIHEVAGVADRRLYVEIRSERTGDLPVRANAGAVSVSGAAVH